MGNLKSILAKKILIIDEQSIIGLELQKKLEQSGYKVVRANSFDQSHSNIKPDLVISDTAPSTSSCLYLFKKALVGKSLPIICTNSQCIDRLLSVKELIIIANYLKPFDTQEILNSVNEYFKLTSKA
ncbi:MAG: hypothetical protein H0V01_10525 [Bacteroidetes bacterium]|nr:hypothetical protein [Bacteroidota bacterium]HET6245094.1 hypothetical protein [Bacteroidia bacterium]